MSLTANWQQYLQALRVIQVNSFPYAIANPDRFWSKVNKTEGCWEWTASTSRNGYGIFWLPNPRRMHCAHRVSWIIENGPIQDGMFVCHKCDNPRCVRPDHLFLGTAADNVHDMIEKGRQVWPGAPRGNKNGMRLHPESARRGESNHNSKITTEIVRTIRSSSEPASALAKRYGVTKANITLIRRREAWAHVD